MESNNDLAKKDLLSFAANGFMKNSNPGNGKTRSASMSISRDISKSFFNFIFKRILEASKKTPIISLWFIVWHIDSIVKSNQDQDYWSSI